MYAIILTTLQNQEVSISREIDKINCHFLNGTRAYGIHSILKI